jgi:hypothetical protein
VVVRSLRKPQSGAHPCRWSPLPHAMYSNGPWQMASPHDGSTYTGRMSVPLSHCGENPNSRALKGAAPARGQTG